MPARQPQTPSSKLWYSIVRADLPTSCLVRLADVMADVEHRLALFRKAEEAEDGDRNKYSKGDIRYDAINGSLARRCCPRPAEGDPPTHVQSKHGEVYVETVPKGGCCCVMHESGASCTSLSRVKKFFPMIFSNNLCIYCTRNFIFFSFDLFFVSFFFSFFLGGGGALT